ncbi:MAG: hypothetical protein NTV87_12205, partial [Ignavibacteriae bacterium]|nr:hypothetical protein [Ignavibacteriota bacterium]
MKKITLYLMLLPALLFAFLLAQPDMLTAQYTGGNYGGATVGEKTDSPLPVELSSFTSNISGRNVKLNWITASEQNNSGFEVQRAVFGSEYLVFSKMAFVSGNGNTNSPTTYNFTDMNLNSGKYQYRLKQIDNNGNFEFHNLNGIIEVGIPNK